MNSECEHEVEPYSTEIRVGYLRDNPLNPVSEPDRIVECKKCGAPVDRGRYDLVMSVPDLFNENTWPFGRDE